MIYLDNASTSFHKPDCVFEAVLETAEEEAAGKLWKHHALFLIQDTGSPGCLKRMDRNVWLLPAMPRKH